MESKTKHRIIGALVIIGLVILLLPFFQMNKDLNKKTTIAEAPPFPTPTVQVTANTPMPEADLIPVGNDSILAAQEEMKTVSNTIEPQNDVAPINDVAPNPLLAEANSVKRSEVEPSKQIDNVLNNSAREVTAEPLVKPTKMKTPLVTKSNASTQKLKIENNGLYDFSHPVWVIQIGSFSDKANALRLVNRLRANGYKAFMQEVKTMVGASTRVFVGPEKQQASARTLANKLESNLKIHGVVMSYKPLAI